MKMSVPCHSGRDIRHVAACLHAGCSTGLGYAHSWSPLQRLTKPTCHWVLSPSTVCSQISCCKTSWPNYQCWRQKLTFSALHPNWNTRRSAHIIRAIQSKPLSKSFERVLCINCSGCGWRRDLGAHPLRSCNPSPDEQCGANCRHVPCPPGRASSGHPCPDSTSTERVNQQQPRRAWMRDGTPGGQVHAHVHTARTPCSCRTGPSGGRDSRAGVSVLARSSMPLVWTLNHTVTVSWVISGRQVLHTPIISGWWKVIFPCIGQSVVFICKSFSSARKCRPVRKSQIMRCVIWRNENRAREWIHEY